MEDRIPVPDEFAEKLKSIDVARRESCEEPGKRADGNFISCTRGTYNSLYHCLCLMLEDRFFGG